jgi:DNA-binding response OmpR family regulator
LEQPGRSQVDKAKILVVEDEVALAETLQLNLQGAGFDVVVANDGLEALRLFDQEAPDIATVDLLIPGISGFRLVQLLKRAESPGPIPIIVISALSPQEAEEAARSGVDDFITKPVNFGELIRRIEFLLAKSRVGQDSGPPPSQP